MRKQSIIQRTGCTWFAWFCIPDYASARCKIKNRKYATVYTLFLKYGVCWICCNKYYLIFEDIPILNKMGFEAVSNLMWHTIRRTFFYTNDNQLFIWHTARRFTYKDSSYKKRLCRRIKESTHTGTRRIALIMSYIWDIIKVFEVINILP